MLTAMSASSSPPAGDSSRRDALREDVLEAVRRFAEHEFAPEPFVPGSTTVPTGRRSLDATDLEALTEAVLDTWLTEGRFATRFRSDFAAAAGRASAALVGSGSQANLLATAALFYRLLTRLTNIHIPTDVGDFRLMDRRTVDALNACTERSRYTNGLSNFLDLLDSQRNELDAKRNYLNVQGARFQSTISLIKALGGGWSSPNEAVDVPDECL